ncbi:MAG: arginine--tRNA ligase [Chlamydiae bacterium]|nr:arginine--tRNA ligase [Chlamydiota bacterium]
MTLQEELVDVLNRAIQQAFPEKTWDGAEVTQTAHEQFGHYQCNSCLKMGKELRINPRDAASRIVKEIHSIAVAHSAFAKIEIAGPGFINITLAAEFLAERVEALLQDPFLGVARPKLKQKVIVEFSSPNVAKELHVGHLRSTIIGDSLARIFEFMGEDVLRLNHIGDFGTQFGMLIQFLLEEHPKVLSGEEKTDLTSLMGWYKESKKKFDSNADFKKKAQEQVVFLQSGEESALSAWKMICQISREAFQQIYQLLDVQIKERGESFYGPYLQEIVKDLEVKGLVTLSHGAKCIFLEDIVGRDGEPLPMIIQKSDGGFNYDTTDMAALWHRVHIEKADRIIILTDAGQSLHFHMVFQAAAKAGYYDPDKVRLDHVGFGVVLGPDGKKFKTRSGETEKLIDLLQEAIDQAREIVDERLPEASEEEKCLAAQVLGIGAVKYADLSGNRVKDYVFSYDRMLKFEGNTAAFLLYAFVRIQGIKRKGGFTKPLSADKIHIEHPSEVLLALRLCQFAETLVSVTQDLLPNRLADYLYTLANTFNAFYRDCRVEGSSQEKSRLQLCEATSRVLQKGLELLGLKTVLRM